MSALVVNIGEVWVTVAQRRVVMLVRMGLRAVPILAAFVLMVLIVPMHVGVRQ